MLFNGTIAFIESEEKCGRYRLKVRTDAFAVYGRLELTFVINTVLYTVSEKRANFGKL